MSHFLCARQCCEPFKRVSDFIGSLLVANIRVKGKCTFSSKFKPKYKKFTSSVYPTSQIKQLLGEKQHNF